MRQIRDWLLTVVTLAFVLWAKQAEAQCGVARFRPPLSYATGTYPQVVVVGDFNEDGTPDLAIANRGDSSVSILLGVGDGSFRPPVTFPSGGASGIAIGDFNRDGHLDIVTANGDQHVSVLFGDGHGTLSAPNSIVAGFYTYQVAVADLNGDRNLDIAVINGSAGQQVFLLFGDGTGGFGPAQVLENYGVGFIASMAVADVDGDGEQDLILAAASTVAVRLGHGDGTFTTPKTFPVTGNANYVAAGDLNGDGVPDLVVVSAQGASGSGFASVFLGQGAGNFTFDNSYAPATDSMGDVTSPFSAAIGDFDMDGKPDLAVASFGTYGAFTHYAVVSLFQGDGAGHFAPPIAFHLGEGKYTYSIAAADLNGDGALDLAVTNILTTNVLINSTRGPLLYFTIEPCRIADTRVGPEPPLQAGHTSFLAITGKCGIPTTARAVSANLTVVNPSQMASVSVFPGDLASTGTNTISFHAGGTRASNALLTLDGSCGVNATLTLGEAHLVLDVSGYFQ